jgi:hypothetical protein
VVSSFSFGEQAGLKVSGELAFFSSLSNTKSFVKLTSMLGSLGAVLLLMGGVSVVVGFF